MADTDTTETTQAPSLDRGTDKLNAVVSNLNQAVDKLSTTLGSMGGSDTGGLGGAQVSVEQLRKYMEAAKGDAVKLASAINKEANNVSLSPAASKFKSLSDAAKSVVGDITDKFGYITKFIKQNAGQFDEILGSAGIIGATKFQKFIIETLGDKTGYNIAQKNLMEIQQQAYQMGAAFKGALGESQQNFNFFNRSFRESIMMTKSFPQDILAVHKGLKGAFGDTDVVTNMAGLAKAQGRISASLNLQNTALLLNKAGLLDVGRTTEYMKTAHTELGESIEGTALAFGRIAESSKGSGIGFERTAESIFKSAQTLKMWGGTIGGVAPIFDMFSRSLKGTGREGLTPELLQSFVGGLNQMGTSTKALLGIQAGAGGAGGAIGGALEMEEAMEKGPEGMKKIVDSLKQTLTQFGGGKIITRSEAIADPAAQSNFLLQRQLLGQLLKVDEATATKTLDALSKMGAAGIETGSNAEEALGQILGSGEQVANETTTTMEKLSQQEVAAINAGAGGIIQQMQKWGDKLGVGAVSRGADDTIRDAIISGQVQLNEAARNLSRASRQRDSIKERVEETRAAGREPSKRQVNNLARAEEQVEALRAKNLQQVTASLQQAVASGQVKIEAASRELNRATQSRDTLRNRVQETRNAGREPSQMQIQALGRADQQVDSLRLAIQFREELSTSIKDAMERGEISSEEQVSMTATGQMPDRMVQDAFSQVSQQNLNAMNSIVAKMSQGTASEEELNSFDTMNAALDNLSSNLSGGIKIDPADLQISTEPPSLEQVVQDLQGGIKPIESTSVPVSRRDTRPDIIESSQRPASLSPRRTPTIAETMRGAAPRVPLATIPQNDISARRIRDNVAGRQAAMQDAIRELSVKTMNVEEIFVTSELEKMLGEANDTSRGQSARELVNTTAPARSEPPTQVAINAATTARKEEAQVVAQQAPVALAQAAGQAQAQQGEVFIKVTLEGDSTIRLEPIIRKIVNTMHREN